MSTHPRNTNNTRVTSKVIQDPNHADLVLVGGNVHKLQPKNPEVIDYLGPIYRHGEPAKDYQGSVHYHQPGDLSDTFERMNAADGRTIGVGYRLGFNTPTQYLAGNTSGTAKRHHFIPF